MLSKIRAKNDARLYFKYRDLELDLGVLKTELIKLGYIEHVEGDRFLVLKKLPNIKELREVLNESNTI